MSISYNKLWKLLIDRKLNKTQFKHAIGIGTTTLSKLSKDEVVSMDVMIKACSFLECNIGDVMDILL